MNFSKNLLIEGWRGINHSYAMINQYQIRELLKNNKFKIYFKDVPYAMPEWNKKDNSSGLEDFEERISKLTQPSNKLKIDILYRISFPYRMHGGNANKIFVFGTSEYQTIENMIYQGEELNEKYINKSIKVITSSNWSKAGFIKEGFKENDVLVIPCGVDLKIFKSTPQGITKTSFSLNPSLIKPAFDQLEEVITLIDLFIYFSFNSSP